LASAGGIDAIIATGIWFDMAKSLKALIEEKATTKASS
jgi:hypothetical protein